MRRSSLRVIAAVALVVAVVGVGAPAAFAGGSSILGGGSGFAALEMDQWRADTARSPFNLTVNYVAQGSTFGRNQFSGGSFDYGASDIQYQELEVPDLQARRCNGRALAQCFVYVPVSAGGLAFMYNLVDNSGSRINDLKLTRQAACKIFTGAITKWNDPEIVATNPQFASFNRDIKPVVRADGAGESYVFSEFCIAVVPAVWQGFVSQQKRVGNTDLTPEFLSGKPTSVWPQQGWGNNPNAVANADGTASLVADPTGGPNAITYVAAGYAKVRGFPTASLQNAAGRFTQPDENNVTVALGYAQERGNGTFQLAFNGPDPRAYFPSTYSYVLAQTAGFDPAKGATLAKFLCYAVSQGQVVAPQLRYARLSSALVKIAIDAIVRIPGAPAAAACPVAGAPPPPPPPTVVGSGFAPPPTLGNGSQHPGATVPGGGGNRNGGSNRPGATGSTATPGASHVDVVRVGGFGATGTTVESPDAALARAALANSSSHSSNDASLWILFAGFCVMFAVTTALGRRSATT